MNNHKNVKQAKRCHYRVVMTILSKCNRDGLLSQSWIGSFSKNRSKKGTKCQHWLSHYRLLALKLLVLGKWPEWFWIPICRVSESGNVARERKDSLLIHASISTMFTLFHFYHLVFFCSQVLSFFLTLLSVCVPPYSWLPLFLLYCLILWDFYLLS